jgi:putative transposase
VYKTVQQTVNIEDESILKLMDTFKYMVNHCIRVGLKNKKGKKYPSRMRLHYLCYRDFTQRYEIHTEYIGSSFAKASGILRNVEHSEKRGTRPKSPFMKLGFLASTHSTSFKIKDDILYIPIGGANNRGKFLEIKLNNYILKTIKDMQVKSFTLSKNKLSLAYTNPKQKEIIPKGVIGLDRNLDCVTIGNKRKGVLKISLKKPREIVENTRKITKSVKRLDKRIQDKVKRKYGIRQRNRVKQYLHRISKFIVDDAKKNKQAIVIEDITHVRKKHTKAINKIKSGRFNINSWSFGEIKTQIEYKAAWAGVPIIQLSKEQTMYTSQTCHKCGEITQYDQTTRLTFCKKCNLTLDRDILAAINIAERGGALFHRSKGPPKEAKSLYMIRQMVGK